ncbi:hypothetical protein ACQVDT_21410 [Streptomyces sp. RMIT01]
MRRALVPAAIAVLALAGCSAEDTPKAAESSSSAPAVSSIPSPDADQTKALTDALSAIKPELAQDTERAVNRARNVCKDVQDGKDEATVAANANARFSGGSASQLTDAQGAEIVTAVKSSFCA